MKKKYDDGLTLSSCVSEISIIRCHVFCLVFMIPLIELKNSFNKSDILPRVSINKPSQQNELHKGHNHILDGHHYAWPLYGLSS